jgi:hypothetical protein
MSVFAGIFALSRPGYHERRITFLISLSRFGHFALVRTNMAESAMPAKTGLVQPNQRHHPETRSPSPLPALSSMMPPSNSWASASATPSPRPQNRNDYQAEN